MVQKGGLIIVLLMFACLRRYNMGNGLTVATREFNRLNGFSRCILPGLLPPYFDVQF